MTRRGGRGRVIAVGSAVGALLLAAAALAQGEPQGTVGGPPTNPEFHHFPKPRGEVLVIGVGRTVVGRVEIVGFDSRFGLCVDTDFLDQGSGHGGCGSDPTPDDNAIEISGWGGSNFPRRSRFSYIEGAISPEVAAVTVRARHDNGIRTPTPVLTQVGTELAARLNQDEAFGRFLAVVRGCVEVHRFRVVAFDVTGNRLGADRIGKGDIEFCGRDNDLGGGGSAILAPPKSGH